MLTAPGKRQWQYFCRLRVQYWARSCCISGPDVVRVSKCLYSQCLASELALAVFRGLFPNSGEVVLDNYQNLCFQKSFAFEMPQRFLATSPWRVGFFRFGGGRAQKMPRIVLLRASVLDVSAPGDHYLKLGCWRLLVLGGFKIARSCDIYYWGVVSGFSALGKMPPNTWFCSLFLAPHTVGMGRTSVSKWLLFYFWK